MVLNKSNKSGLSAVAKAYAQAFNKWGDDPKSVMFPKGRQFERYTQLYPYELPYGATVLDFGCGLAKMYQWLIENGRADINYTGIDVTEAFVSHNLIKYPNVDFRLLKNIDELTGSWDFVFASGVFSLLYFEDREKHKEHMFHIISQLFLKHTDHFFAADFMNTKVDFVQPGAFHLSVEEAVTFICNALSRRFEISASKFKWEFSIRVWKDQVEEDNGIYCR